MPGGKSLALTTFPFCVLIFSFSSGIKLVSVSRNYTVDENFQISLSFHVVSFGLGRQRIGFGSNYPNGNFESSSFQILKIILVQTPLTRLFIDEKIALALAIILFPVSFQGINLRQDLRGNQRIIMGNQTLVLQSLRRNASGNYYCVATNSEGFTLSNAVRLNVKCKYDYIYIDKTHRIEQQGIHDLSQ